MTARVVNHRIDFLKLAFRVALDPQLVLYLKERKDVACKHGAASVRWGRVVGAMKFSKASNQWHIDCGRYQIQLWARGPGAELVAGETESIGWTCELIWSAQELANFGSPDPAVVEAEQIAADLGTVYEARLRRLDLCADVAGWLVQAVDAERLVRRSRAKLDVHDTIPPDDGGAIKLHNNTRGATGITICPGGAFMARLYNKREELAIRGDADKTAAENARWKQNGALDDEPITRVEFQLQGVAVKELGLRNPNALIHPKSGEVLAKSLSRRVDAVWQKCLEWLKLVQLTRERRSECPLDPMWRALTQVRFFVEKARAALRFRIRRHASPEQTLGCALSLVGARLGLEPVKPLWRAMYQASPVATLDGYVQSLFERAAAVVVDELIEKWGDAKEALEHVIEVHDAARARFGDVPQLEPPEHRERLREVVERLKALGTSTFVGIS